MVSRAISRADTALDALIPYPSAAAYLARQPDGWASHPECVGSSELVTTLLRSGALDGLEEVLAFMEDDGSGWRSEVAMTATLLALKDTRFRGNPDSDESFVAWMESLNRPLVVGREPTGGPSATPYRIRDVWTRLHRGTPMVVRSVSTRGAIVALSHPRELWPDFVHEWRRRAFLASLASDGAAQPTAIVRSVDTGTDYELSW